MKGTRKKDLFVQDVDDGCFVDRGRMVDRGRRMVVDGGGMVNGGRRIAVIGVVVNRGATKTFVSSDGRDDGDVRIIRI